MGEPITCKPFIWIMFVGTLDREKVCEALRKGGLKTFFGTISFAPSGIANLYTPPVLQVQHGKVRVIYPANIRTTEFCVGVQ